MKKLLFLILFSFESILSLNAQWERCNNGIPICELSSLTTDSVYIYVGSDYGVYRTIDSGNIWTPRFNFIDSKDWNILALTSNGEIIFAGTFWGSILLSTAQGDSWSLKKINFIDSSSSKSIWSILINGNEIYAATDQGIFLTTDIGDNWIVKNNGLPIDTLTNLIRIKTLAIKGDKIYAGTENEGVYMSTDNGDNWVSKNNGLINKLIWSLGVKGNMVYAGTESGLFLSTDNGDNWKRIGFIDSLIEAIYIKDNYIFVSGYPGVYISPDNGIHWTKNDSLLQYYNYFSSLIIFGDYIFGADTFHGIFRAKLSDLITVVKESVQNNETMIYPNPSSGKFNIKLVSSEIGQFRIMIYDILGNIIYTNDFDKLQNEATFNIDLTGSGTGTYFYKLISPNAVVSTGKIFILK
jgi:Secretion system C-terminal sorting domain